ncbi:MAG: ParB N-terminal domain-containing protein [Sedimentisphaerales bacterium]|nr:ParB N-terminal domain-containing protein [Sedimentisphaerales bacterium]
MASKVPMAFRSKGVTVSLDNILPLKTLPPTTRTTPRYQRIKASMQEVGIIEPPVVYPQKGQSGVYMMLDGHLRLDVAKELNFKSLFCLVATDDEAFTYNHKVNQLTSIQEHFMILKAIKNGVSEERIAKTLNINVATVKQKRDLLKDICPEAVEHLKNRRVSAGAIREMKRVKAIRQIEMAELMVSSNNYTTVYAKCLLAASPPDQLVESEKQSMSNGLEQRDIARLQSEMENLEREFKLVQEEYGQNMLNLVVVVGYLRSLLDNAAVVRFLSQVEPAMLTEFQRIIDTSDLRATG